MAKLEITIEATIHEEMRQVAKSVYEKFGIIITSVNFDWDNWGDSSGANNSRLSRIEITTGSSTARVNR